MDLAQQILSRNGSMKSEASQWRTTWQDIADYIQPRKGNITTERQPGESQTVQIFDTTAEESLLIFAAGLLSQLVPPGEIWARYESEDKDASSEVKKWFDSSTQKALELIYGSNFYLAIHEDFMDAGAFATSATYCEEGSKRFALNFNSIPVGSYAIAEDNEGAIDTVFREWKWTARQAEQQWGRDALGPLVAKALTDKDPGAQDKKFTFVHAVYPRRKGDFKEGAVAAEMRPIASIYVCAEDKNVIEEGGFYEMPYAVSRLMRSNGEVYGRGPGTQALPEVKLVNRMEYDILLALEKSVNPGWLMPEDSAYKADNRPGGTTFWDTTNPNNKPEQMRSEARIDLGEQKIEQKRDRIRRAFFVDMFQMLNRPEVLKRDMTARQVGEMVQEKLLLFAPFFARITTEKLGPLLERVFGILMRGGHFDEPPQELIESGGRYKIVYTSKIALAIKAAQEGAMMDMLSMCSMMTPYDQSVPMVIKWRDAYRLSARNRGVPVELMREDSEIDEMIAQQQKAAEAQQAAAMAESVSATAKNLGPEAQGEAVSAMRKASRQE